MSEQEYVVEYAMEAISHAGTVLGVLSKEGVVLAAEKTSQLASALTKRIQRSYTSSSHRTGN